MSDQIISVLNNLTDAEKLIVFEWAMDQDLTKEPFSSIPVRADHTLYIGEAIKKATDK